MLELKSISKNFPGVKALDSVSLQFEPGKIHALVGENGAGKSTLIKIITGIYQPDGGEIHFNGERLCFQSYRDSLARGIDIVYQEIQVIPDSTIAENIMLDKMVTYGGTGIVNWNKINEIAATYTAMVGLNLPVSTPVRGLSAAQKQLVQIAKALAAHARVLLLDEPTSSLTEHEANNLFVMLRKLRDDGVTILFVSHKFEEVFAICDTISVMRDGRHVGTRPAAELTRSELVRMMIGRDCKDEHLGRLDVNRDRELLRVEHLTRTGKARDICFSLHEGEILGLYGLVGAGRTELARLLIGEDTPDSGAVFIDGRQAHIRSVADSLYHYKMGYVTENRKEEGLLLKEPIRTNITITVWNRLINRLTRAISPARESGITGSMIESLQIKATSHEQKTEDLSGGNQQKVSIAKWLAADCDILIIDEPTVGVDIGAKDQIHRLIWSLAKTSRKGILLISSDMPEIIKVSSRILVFKDKGIVGELTGVDDPARTYEELSTAIGRHLQ